MPSVLAKTPDTNLLTHPAASAAGEAELSLGQRIVLGLLTYYKVCLSPWLPSACKFYPTCSMFAQEAVRLHGVKRGSWMALKRLGRCHPFTRGGFDPVPDA